MHFNSTFSSDVVETLLDSGANVNDTSDGGRTALHMAAWSNRSAANALVHMSSSVGIFI
jgi:ankyrin repeat protein